ncbi:MAG: hypothetical protein K2I73_00375 [Eubacterium sp.]|nr:hypothetical protein [Eubacterium sp.]
MKGHLKRIGTFLIYTLIFNVVSFSIYFFHAFLAHKFEGAIWLVFGIAQICFTILIFNKILLPKISNEKGIKIDLFLYFIILCILSIVAAIYRSDWFAHIFFNTYYTFPLSSSIFDDTLGVYIGIYFIENALKTYLLYTNISKKLLSKPICIALSVIMILAYIVFFFLLVIF